MDILEEFKPMLTPKEMLHKGIFGGTYFAELIDHNNFPSDWFEGLDESYYCSSNYLSHINLFKIRSGQTQKEWEEKGWIHEDDPRGWFEWYCKFFLGRRHEDDQRQINRWKAFCGQNGRWKNTIYTKLYREGCPISESFNVSPRIQQSLLHWSYLVNEKDFKDWKSSKGINPKEY